MDFANDQLVPMADLDRQLTILQTDTRLLKYLGLLEQSALEAEGLQEALEVGDRLGKDMEGRQKERLQEELSQSFARTRRLDIRIRACCSAAQDLPGQMDGMKEIGDLFNSMNPFRNRVGHDRPCTRRHDVHLVCVSAGRTDDEKHR
eukprot:1772849-Amphidinium_carterae.1